MSDVRSGFAAAQALTTQIGILSGPISGIGYAYLRSLVGINDISGARRLERSQQRGTSVARGSPTYEPIYLGVSDAVRLLHTRNDAATPAAWGWLQSVLSSYGVDVALPGEATGSQAARDWREYVQLSATDAPLEAYITNYYRLGSPDPAAALQASNDLDAAFGRGGYSRPKDRELLLSPWANWNADDVAKLYWFGLIDDSQRIQMLKSAGFVREDDLRYARQMQRQLPGAEQLLEWEARRLWDETLAVKYGMDVLPTDNAVPQFFAAAQGLGAEVETLPGEPDGNKDWRELTYRASRPLIDFGTAQEMQHRFRPTSAGGDVSVVTGVPAWTERNTRDMLLMHGWSQPCIDYMIGLTTRPLDVRIVNEILLQILKNPDIAAEAARTLGASGDWVKGVFLDHGYADQISQLAADGLRSRADLEYNAEKVANVKAIRDDKRKAAIAAYELGTTDAATASIYMQDQFFDAAMALQTLQLVDEGIKLGIQKRQLAAIRETYLRGSITLPAATAALASLGFEATRIAQYEQEWIWDRTEAVRTLGTTEVLGLLKQGLLTPAAALVRLANLGWADGDALLEVTQVQHELMQQQLKAAVEAAKQAQAEQAKADKAAEAAAKTQAAEVARIAKADQVQADKDALAVHENLLATNVYYASVAKDDAELAKAKKKGDVQAENEAASKLLAAYQKWLIEQLKIQQEASSAEVTELQTLATGTPAAGTGQSSGGPGGAASGGGG